MTTVAGLDYSTKAVHAAIVGDKQLRYVRVYELTRSPEDVLRVLPGMFDDLKARGVSKVYMEATFFVPARIDKTTQKLKQGSNVNTLKLHASANQVQTLATIAGVEITLVAPATWKSQLLTGIPAPDTKQRSMWFVRRVWGYDVKGDHNKADAICLATYGEAMVRLNGLIPPALEVR